MKLSCRPTCCAKFPTPKSPKTQNHQPWTPDPKPLLLELAFGAPVPHLISSSFMTSASSWFRLSQSRQAGKTSRRLVQLLVNVTGHQEQNKPNTYTKLLVCAPRIHMLHRLCDYLSLPSKPKNDRRNTKAKPIDSASKAPTLRQDDYTLSMRGTTSAEAMAGVKLRSAFSGIGASSCVGSKALCILW